jgi:hypothetical protein
MMEVFFEFGVCSFVWALASCRILENFYGASQRAFELTEHNINST